jgi:hypothetical protein
MQKYWFFHHLTKNDGTGTRVSQAGEILIPVENVTAAQKWSRLNHPVATFGVECLLVGWL